MKKKQVILLWRWTFFMFILNACSPTKSTNNNTSSSALVGDAAYVFEGTVQQSNAVNLSILKNPQGHAIVKVDHIIDAPDHFNAFLNKAVTVKMHPDSKLNDGQKVTFFANDWLYGESIALVEAKASYQEEDLREKVVQSVQLRDDEKLYSLLTSARAVVFGEVVSVYEGNREAENYSEHSPEWKTAEINVEKVLKGDLKRGTVEIEFPSSRDVMWVYTAKYSKGQRGVWLLYQNQAENARIKGYTALYKENFYEEKEQKRIEKLLKNGVVPR